MKWRHQEEKHVLYFVLYYYMVGVAVAIVISTIHEKIMHRFAQCTEIWKKGPKSVIHTSCNHKMKLRRRHSQEVIIIIRRNYSESYFLQIWARITIWIIIDFIKNYRHKIYKTDYSNYFQFTHICVHILCRFSDTEIIMTSQRRCYARDQQNHA